MTLIRHRKFTVEFVSIRLQRPNDMRAFVRVEKLAGSHRCGTLCVPCLDGCFGIGYFAILGNESFYEQLLFPSQSFRHPFTIGFIVRI